MQPGRRPRAAARRCRGDRLAGERRSPHGQRHRAGHRRRPVGHRRATPRLGPGQLPRELRRFRGYKPAGSQEGRMIRARFCPWAGRASRIDVAHPWSEDGGGGNGCRGFTVTGAGDIVAWGCRGRRAGGSNSLPHAPSSLSSAPTVGHVQAGRAVRQAPHPGRSSRPTGRSPTPAPRARSGDTAPTVRSPMDGPTS